MAHFQQMCRKIELNCYGRRMFLWKGNEIAEPARGAQYNSPVFGNHGADALWSSVSKVVKLQICV